MVVEPSPRKQSTDSGEEIHHVVVIGMYPNILKYGKFLVGHPKVYVGAHCPLNVRIGRG